MTFLNDLTVFTAPIPFTVLMGIVGLLVGSFFKRGDLPFAAHDATSMAKRLFGVFET